MSNNRTAPTLAMAKQAPLCLIDRARINSLPTLLAVYILVPLEQNKQGSVNPKNIPLPDRTLPKSLQGRVDLVSPLMAVEVFRILNLLPGIWKQQRKFFISRLEQAERTIRCAVDDLNILRGRLNYAPGLSLVTGPCTPALAARRARE